MFCWIRASFALFIAFRRLNALPWYLPLIFSFTLIMSIFTIQVFFTHLDFSFASKFEVVGFTFIFFNFVWFLVRMSKLHNSCFYFLLASRIFLIRSSFILGLSLIVFIVLIILIWEVLLSHLLCLFYHSYFLYILYSCSFCTATFHIFLLVCWTSLGFLFIVVICVCLWAVLDIMRITFRKLLVWWYFQWTWLRKFIHILLLLFRKRPIKSLLTFELYCIFLGAVHFMGIWEFFNIDHVVVAETSDKMA